MPVALVTGASRGFGLAVATALADLGWNLIIDGRDAAVLHAAAAGMAGNVTAIPGDVGDPAHRADLAAAANERLDLLVNNAGALGPSPLPPLARYPADALLSVLATNTVAPLALAQLVLPALRAARGAIVNVSSDAAVEPYAGWGGYGASKAALDQLTAVLAVEEPSVNVYSFDPGDMRTATHQAAYPGEDISDRAEPLSVVPALLHLVDQRPASGRYRAAELPSAAQVAR
jgi:NAD(P)-dependent dehydrogenase (short-subunit alcohol dehydrogenase family)